MTVRHYLEHAAYRSFKAMIGFLPEPVRRQVGPALGRLGYLLDQRHRVVAVDNLRLALPELGERERRDLARSCFASFGSLLIDALGSSSFDRDLLLDRYQVEGWQHLEEAEAAGRGVLLLTAHLGNWEGLAQYLALRGKIVSFVARPLDNPLIETDLRRGRERFGNRTIPKRSAGRQCLRVLRDRGRVGLLIDQRVPPNVGKAYPFFGRTAWTTPLPAQLSIRTGAPALPLFGIPSQDWQDCRIAIHPPIWPDRDRGIGEAAVDALTVRYLEVIERVIREYPHLWLWTHRRWRQYPTEIRNRRGVAQAPEAPALQQPAPAKLMSASSSRSRVRSI